MSARLWEVDHPYYAMEGNYYRNGEHEECATWADFLAGYGDLDLDMNLIYRWDWNVPDPRDYFDEEGNLYDDEEPVPGESLSLFYMGQRKARCWSVRVTTVTRDQEPEIREWLTVRAEHMRKVWEPLLDGAR